MPHQYKRRVYDEAMEVAREHFRDSVQEHLSSTEIEELRTDSRVTGGSIGGDWIEEVGFQPDPRLFYEFQVYQPREEHPYISKCYARILVPRDRDSQAVWVKWKPPLLEHERSLAKESEAEQAAP
jgi:uncharacterized protein YciU (UPF0263 family)